MASKPKADWQEDTLARMRALILEADPEMIEERKWRKPSNAMAGIPVWSHDGIVCTGEMYMRRAIDIREGEQVKSSAFKALVRQAVALNRSGKSRSSKTAKS